MILNDVFEFIHKHDLMVVSTVDAAATPESAVVEFGEYGEHNLVMDTLTTSRKFKNLATNNKTSLVIGWDNDITVQINAIAHILEGEELLEAKRLYFEKNQRARKWENREGIAYFGFKPTWIRYSDVGQNPWVIEEFRI